MITKNTDTIRYTTGGLCDVSIDTKQIDPMMGDYPMQEYEDVEVEVNPLPTPPKSKAKTAPKKYANTGYSQPYSEYSIASCPVAYDKQT